MSKFIEKDTARRIEHHIRISDLHDRYRKDHSTETTLIKVHSDICDSLDEGSMAALLLLDLSAAFDVIDHSDVWSIILALSMRHSLG